MSLPSCLSIFLGRLSRGLALLFLCFLLAADADAGDWPQWRYDAGRGAVSPEISPIAGAAVDAAIARLPGRPGRQVNLGCVLTFRTAL